ncbi:indole-3-glycerol phosphate synthase TrpC [Pontibacillus litoralis]|uniref:Indole-3-glycerol phosphate synthase n=1 Tax=Pontibacillus litoralis JSM 072002 TaxID=1385512 RepID=A0A0A5HWY5_9BACI|nr:indole-3-glycerol phosphate synthase TrpC [Pontibacillus litoralis]KGX88147.1 indole-3-glycerol phosphate synthase [Pontibacillus litoralis JSM 072002]
MLNAILEHKREEVKQLQLPAPERVEHYSFSKALCNSMYPLGLIAEVKKASPSKGMIQSNFRPVETALLYEKAGASAISVLTDRRFFQGDNAFLTAIKRATSLPVLRKDFIVDERQVEESKRIGADAILLIGEAMEAHKLHYLYEAARSTGLEVLVEVHSRATLENVLALFQPAIIGINNRDLTTFTTSILQTASIAPSIPNGSIVVSESGIATKEDVQQVQASGAHAVLIGEALMRTVHPVKHIETIMGSD